MNIFRNFQKKSLATVGTFLLIFSAVGCTNVEEWGITAESQLTSAMQGTGQTIDQQADIIRFGDDQQIAQEVIDYSTWAFDPNGLYTDPTYQLTQFGAAQAYQMGDTITIPGRRMNISIEKVDPFLDANGSGKYGISVVYNLTNTSDTIIFLSESTAPSFALFSPEGVSLKAHYDLQGVEPDAEQAYEGRIVYPKDLYNGSMKSMEVPPNTTITIYRMYDFAGPGTYQLYMSTNQSGNLLEESARITFDLTVG